MRYKRPLIFIIFAMALAFTISSVNNPSGHGKITSVPKTVAAIVKEKKPEKKPRQIIEVITSNCWIRNFDYHDPRMLSSGDLSDLKIIATDGDFESAKKIFVERDYLGGAQIEFELKGEPGQEASFGIVNTLEQGKFRYNYACTLGDDGIAHLVAQIVKEGKINNICMLEPETKSFY